jgi:hypothetical protein
MPPTEESTRRKMERKIIQVSYMKYPDATQLVRLLKFRAFPIVERATARVV